MNEGPPIAARGALSDDDRMGAPRCTERTIGMLGDRRLPPAHGDERAILLGWLDWLRATVHRKCDRLSDEAARLRLIPSSELSVASLVSHLRWAEWYWFERCFLGRTSGSDDSTGGWGGGSEPVQDLLSAYEQQCTRSRAIAEEHELSTRWRHTRLKASTSFRFDGFWLMSSRRPRGTLGTWISCGKRPTEPGATDSRMSAHAAECADRKAGPSLTGNQPPTFTIAASRTLLSGQWLDR